MLRIIRTASLSVFSLVIIGFNGSNALAATDHCVFNPSKIAIVPGSTSVESLGDGMTKYACAFTTVSPIADIAEFAVKCPNEHLLLGNEYNYANNNFAQIRHEAALYSKGSKFWQYRIDTVQNKPLHTKIELAIICKE